MLEMLGMICDAQTLQHRCNCLNWARTLLLSTNLQVACDNGHAWHVKHARTSHPGQKGRLLALTSGIDTRGMDMKRPQASSTPKICNPRP